MEFTPLGAELDFDTDQLCSLFDALSQELSKPFVEKRIESGSNKKDPLGNYYLDELTDVINQLNMRERDLQAAIGIAKLLLDNTITLKNTNEDLQQEIEDLESQLRTTKQEMKYLKESLMMTEEQFDRTSSNLRAAEEQISTLTQERDYFRAESEKLAKKSTQSEVVVTKTVEDDSLKKRSNRLESKDRVGICD